MVGFRPLHSFDKQFTLPNGSVAALREESSITQPRHVQDNHSPSQPADSSRLLFILCCGVLTLGVFSFLLACFLPIYTDEITWKAILGRLNYSHMRSITLTLQPSCVANYTFKTPRILLPARMIDTWSFEGLSTPLRMRLWGVGLALGWLLLTWRELCVYLEGRIRKWEVAGLLVAWSTLGVMPFLLVLGRPEQVLLLGSTLLLLRALRVRPQERSAWTQACVAAGILALTWYLLCSHPRGTFLIPLACMCLYRRVSLPWVRNLAIGLASILGFSTQAAWHTLWTCDQDPQFARILSSSNLGTAYSLGLTRQFLLELARSLATPEAWFLKAFVPKANYTASMISPFAFRGAFPLRVAILAGSSLVVALGLVAAIVCAYQALRRRTDKSLALTLLSGWLIYLASVGVRLQKNDYEAALLQPLIGLLAITSILALPATEPDHFPDRLMEFFRRIWPSARCLLLFISILSQCAFLYAYRDQALHQWSQPGQTPGQPLSVDLAGYGAAAARIRHSAAKCGIFPGAPAQHLVLDEPSYFVFRSSREPFFALIFDDHIWGGYRPDPTDLFRAQGSQGFVAACNRFPSSMRGEAIRDGDLCCLPAFH
ncbi:hypothetical protein AciPR4_3133 [Terriglobus saanensis SP1PR4]|uniref:Glycosyltransferase RgtA/B/C/D-like domain-containing protein n=1 Tax=Terriglobus saanensis (strain ATCC BAA-1853 / DSM 23119 / SP1PR4) TaxID=401053 RepID=E8V6T9_TERSS|nr:hypothetical protein AciPR4_3133 [Terriglobus saanensis SP1PR4]